MELGLLRQGVNSQSTLHTIIDWVLADFIGVRTHLELALMHQGVNSQSTLRTIGFLLLLHLVGVLEVRTHLELALMQQEVYSLSTLHIIIGWVLTSKISCWFNISTNTP